MESPKLEECDIIQNCANLSRAKERSDRHAYRRRIMCRAQISDRDLVQSPFAKDKFGCTCAAKPSDPRLVRVDF